MYVKWKSTKLNFTVKFDGISGDSFLPSAFIHYINIYKVQIMFCGNR